MPFSRQEYWSGLPFPPAGDLPDSGIELESPVSPASAGRLFTTVPPRKPLSYTLLIYFNFGCAGPSLLWVLFSSCSRWGPLSSCSALPSHCDDSFYCRTQAPGCLGFSSCGTRAPEHRLSSCGALAQLLRSMWDTPGPGRKPMSSALAGEFFTTEPPGKPLSLSFEIPFFSSAPSISLLLI